MNIYVGNLAKEVSEQELQSLFSEFGEVKNAKIIKDFNTNEPRGFGFVEMSSDDEGNSAIQNLNEKEFKGKALVVNVARPKKRDNRNSRPGFRKR